MSDGNPYEELDLDPSLSPSEITEELRDRAEVLPPSERAHIQGLWQSLTVKSASRARHAMLARPRIRRTTELAAVVKTIRPVPPIVDIDDESHAAGLLARLRAEDLGLPPRPILPEGTRVGLEAALAAPFDPESVAEDPYWDLLPSDEELQ